MVRGCMSLRGVGATSTLHDWSAVESGVLQPDLATANHLWFQQDGAPKYVSRLATGWSRQNGIEVMPWAARSPDLDPNLGPTHTPASCPKAPREVHELGRRNGEELADITADACQSIVEFVSSRLEAPIKAKNGHTRF